MTKKTITIYDVAREAGVSMATVSRVVNGNPNVKPETRKKVADVIDRLNYRPNAVARGLASKKTTTVGVIIPNVTNLFFASLARGIDDIASMYKYNIILANSDENPDKEIQVFNTLLAQQVDGLIYMGHEVSEALHREIQRSNTPLVVAGTVVEDPKVASVNIDYREAVTKAIEELLEHTDKVAIVTGPAEWRVNEEFRIPGYIETMKAHNLPIDEDFIVQSKFKYEDGDRIAERLLMTGAKAALVYDDEIAIGILNGLLDRGVKVPEDFQLMTSNNSVLTQYVRPQLSSIQLPLYDIGAVAMRLLTKIMDDEELEHHKIYLPSKLILRDSTLN